MNLSGYYPGSLAAENRLQFLGSDFVRVLSRLIGGGATPDIHNYNTELFNPYIIIQTPILSLWENSLIICLVG